MIQRRLAPHDGALACVSVACRDGKERWRVAVNPPSGGQPEVAVSPEELWQMGLTIRDAPAALPGVLEAFRTKGAGEPTDFGLTEADKQVGLIWRKLHPTICEVMPLVGKKLISTGLAVQMWGAEFAKADETHRKNIEALAAADAAKHQPR